MIFNLITDPLPEKFFMFTNMKAEQGELVLCIITDEDLDIEDFQKDSQAAKDVLTLNGLMMLQEPVYVGHVSDAEKKDLIIDIMNDIKDEIIGEIV